MVFIYAAFAALWILFSDQAVTLITDDPRQIALISTVKGWLFVAVTSSLLAVTLRRYLKQLTSINEELQRSETRYRSFAEELALGIVVTQDGIIKYVNPAATVISGYPETELVGKPFVFLVCEADRQWLMEVHRRRMQGEAVEPTCEIGVIRKDGEARRWQLHTSTIEWEGKLSGYGIITDITERKRAEDALRDSELRYRRLANSSPLAIQVFAPDGKTLRVNDAWERMWETTFSALENYNVLEDRQLQELGILALLRRSFAGESVEFPVHEYVKERTPEVASSTGSLWIRAFSYPVQGEDGQILEIVLVQEDVTERKQAEDARALLEAQLRESQKMEALGTLAGGVAHDFNNALTVITGNVELARQDVGPNHPATVSLDEIDKTSRRAKDMVQQILAFGRRQAPDRKPTSLALIVVESARLIRASLPAMVTLNVECKPDTPAVLADATQVKQVLLNLCANALHAVQMQDRPGVIEVSLSAHVQEVAQARLQPGRYARLCVRDNGCGMDAATRSRVFEPFFTTKPKETGTGLGLAVVHGIAKEHGAALDVSSVPGEGSEFCMYFPAVDAPVVAADAPAASTASVKGDGQHILFVDDEEAITFLMQRLLERKGYRVSTFTDAKEALAALRANAAQFDLLVTDYNMPGMSGLELAELVREIRGDLPIVLASGYITEDLRQKAPGVGIGDLIYKPNTVDDLCEAVARAAAIKKSNP